MAEEQPEFEEIDLRDYLEILSKRRWIILGTFSIFVVAAVLINLVVLTPIYRSTARIIITTPPLEKISEFRSYQELLNFEAFNPVVYNPPTYMWLLKRPSLEEKLIQTLNLGEKIEKGFSSEELEELSSLRVIEDARTVELSVESKDPKLAKDIANTWVRLFVEQIRNSKLEAYSTLKNNLESKLSTLKKQLNEAENKKREFEGKNNIDLLEKEIRQKSSKLVEDRGRISELKKSIIVEKAKIKELQRQLKEENKVIVLTESLAEHPLLSQLTTQITGEKVLNNFQVKTEHLNPVYQNIKTQLGSSQVNLSAYQQEAVQLEKEIQNLTSKIEELRKELADQKLTQQKINREFELAESIYNNLSHQLEEIKGVEPVQREDVKIATLARAAEKPIKPKKERNIAIGAVLGLLVGVIGAFGVEWWSREEDKKGNS